MSRFWPHSPYAEEQRYPQSILTVHVLTRGVQAGTVVGSGVGTFVYLLRHFRVLAPRIPPSTFTATVLRSAGVGVVVATGLLGIGIPLRMRGKEEIEWKDRSWRLLENKGQVECDDWTYPGILGGLAVAAMKGTSSGWRGAVGSVGIGSMAGALGYMGWRYGVKGGKFEEGDL